MRGAGKEELLQPPAAGEGTTTLPWAVCVLDEGHVIRNPATAASQACRRIRARHRIVLSGTPVQNSVMDLWAVFDFLVPGLLGSHGQFQKSYRRPVQASRQSGATAAQLQEARSALKQLHSVCLPFVLRRMKQDVLPELPPKVIQDVVVELQPR